MHVIYYIIFITDQGSGDSPDFLSGGNSTASDSPDLLRDRSTPTDGSKGKSLMYMILVNSLYYKNNRTSRL